MAEEAADWEDRNHLDELIDYSTENSLSDQVRNFLGGNEPQLDSGSATIRQSGLVARTRTRKISAEAFLLFQMVKIFLFFLLPRLYGRRGAENYVGCGAVTL